MREGQRAAARRWRLARGNVSFEIKPLPGEDSAVMIAAARRKLAEAWARLTI